MLSTRLSFVVCMLVLVCASVFSKADILTLKDGTVYEGVITKQSSAQVTIEIVISNIKTTKTFPRYKVKSIEIKPVENIETEKPKKIEKEDQEPETDSDSDRSKTRTRTSKPRSASKTQYMVIPVVGMIGEETNADGLRKALMQARKRKIEHVVFTIDSGGGYVYDAVEALKVLKEFDEDIEYHALVEEGAISAASIYVAAADNIFVRPDARVGGAVAYSEESSNAKEVDAKFNSIWAAEVAARADSKGHPPEVFRAMVVLEAEVWLDAENKVSNSRPTRGGNQIDSRSTILTIRAGQMVDIGMAREFKGELSELGELLDINDWAEARGMGERIMNSSAKLRVKLSEKFTKAIKAFSDANDNLKENNPSRFSDYRYYRQRNGDRVADGSSIRLWRQRSLECIGYCDIMLRALHEIASVNKQAKKIGAIHLDIIPNELGDDAFNTINEDRNTLHANQNQIPQSVLGG